ncbi:DUF4926 domain-containing protein [Desulfosoma sp.]
MDRRKVKIQTVHLFDVVELIVDSPRQGLYAGMQGPVLDVHENGRTFEIEFSDEQGRVLNFLALAPEQFIVVRRSQEQQWVPLAERIAKLVSRLPESVGIEVLDFARLLTAGGSRRSSPQGARVRLAEGQSWYKT